MTMTRRFDPYTRRPRDPRPPWEEDDPEGEREGRELFERESQFARTSGDPRWGTGGMPVEDRPYRRDPSAPSHEWPERRAYLQGASRHAPSYAAWDDSTRGPYVGRGPRGYRRSDEKILEDVCERFTEHGLLDPSDVEVTVRGGEVILSGTVGTRAEKRLAEDIADLVFGVVEVHNRLRVQRPGEAPRPASGPPAVNGTLDR